MFIDFLFNMSLIVLFSLLSSRIKERVIRRGVDDLKLFKLGISLFYSLNSMLVMMQPFINRDGRFDLRTIPIFLVTYSWGWQYGLITAVLPSLYRIHLGGPGILQGLIFDILLIVLIGGFFYRKRSILENIDQRRVLKVYALYLLICLTGLMWLNPEPETVILIVFWYPLFSLITLFAIIIIVNETNQSIRHNVVDYGNLEAVFFENKKRLEHSLARVDLFGKLSHEFKTPLNLIFSSLQMLVYYHKKEDETKFCKYIDLTRQNAYRILRLINNLIDLVKIDANYFKLNLQEVDLIKTISETVHSIEGYIEEKNRVFIFRTNVFRKIISCDPVSIERILLNLLSNAVKFTDEGDIITVRVEDRGEQIEISVKDTGIGIREENLDKIFEEFIQVDDTSGRNHEGSGLGLAIIKLLVEMHEGEVRVWSKEGIGTEFIITLPVRRALTEEPGPEVASDIDRIQMEFSDIY